MSINTSRGRTSNTRPFTILPSLNSRDGDRASSSFMSVMDCVLHLGLPFDLHAGQPTLDANHREGRRKVGTTEPKASSNSSCGTDAARSRGTIWKPGSQDGVIFPLPANANHVDGERVGTRAQLLSQRRHSFSPDGADRGGAWECWWPEMGELRTQIGRASCRER